MSSTGPRTGSVPATPVVDRRRRRTLSDDAAPAFFTSALDGAPRWVAGVLSALQAALLSLLVLALPAVAAYVATSADPSNSGVGWFRSVGVGTSLWLLGHGVPAQVGAVTVSLVPLGVTVLAIFVCYASARRSGLATWPAYAAGIGTYTLVAVVLALLDGVSGSGLLRAVVGGAAVAAVGLGTGLLARPEAPALRDLTRRGWSRFPAPLRTGAAGGVLAAAALVLVAAAVATLWVVAGRATIGDVVRGLGLDAVGGVVLAVAELAYLPNLVVWALAWLTGAGFAVGDGTHFAPDGVVGGPLPAVPMLGALPTPDIAGPATSLVPLVLVVVGALVGWYLHRRLVTQRWWECLAACATAGVTAFVVVTLLVTAASGGVGPDRLSDVGAQGAWVGLLAGAGVLVGALLVALPGDRPLRAEVGRALRGLRRGADGA
ncbi:cell division protein PerM [Cellulomonas sp. ICMP 17802]|uniref:cell division protein PerM n=1 Tax=Cellulomonas sp. ICMP 17802 TaxID=3239199 RepID=UPI00351B231D